ncbi:molybdenum cofactor biosynthesis protein A [Parvularcula bermudensis HTCC2503]|uniref:Molybdenum cofactor biosynthesis protein A n=1 Tax=Parvularcula bermudensis (strain ATCC BAA-594 / HTCC2503 / KCTC 12087) TaxID=314260 RepID=E0TDF1_PARBH|nr:molybdenum cofactor biosynthesis protein A [Parvularcula bermudensis]ADM10377.1 molybdenum cofactor biosynthesis protein A [Parvularcula bermudensis HTCC2503]
MAFDDRANIAPLTDGYGRDITYLRLSVTDRCDLRCQYCLAARPDFLPKSALLSGEELAHLAATFIRRGGDLSSEGADYLMDYLKTAAPFWKRERGDQGERWIEPRAADFQDKDRWGESQ